VEAPAATAAGVVGTPAATAAAALALGKSVHERMADSQKGEVKALCSLAYLLGVSEAAAGCIQACRPIQLLGCANLGCTTLPSDRPGFAQDGLAVNRKKGVCGGCGVVRYCSAACAQQD
jgi:hypothetical protein